VCTSAPLTIVSPNLEMQMSGYYSSVPTLSDKIESLTTAHNTIRKAVSDLSDKIVNLQSQESKLSEQIKATSDAMGKQPTYPSQLPPNRRSNIVLYGVKECIPKALRHERLQNDIYTVLEIFGGINIQLNPSNILDCFHLGKFKQTQLRPRPILIKLNGCWQTGHHYSLHL